jgi:hypothetical protein
MKMSNDKQKVLNFLEWLEKRDFYELNLGLGSKLKNVEYIKSSNRRVEARDASDHGSKIKVLLDFSTNHIFETDPAGKIKYDFGSSSLNLVGEYLYHHIWSLDINKDGVTKDMGIILDDYLIQVFCMYSDLNSPEDFYRRLGEGRDLFICSYHREYTSETLYFYLIQNKATGKLNLGLTEVDD